MITNKVGLEFEFLLRNKDGGLVFPADYGFECDDFIILGEARAKAGTTVEETIGNFYTAYYGILRKAKRKGLTVDLSGYTEITAKFNTEIMKKMSYKEISTCSNIYGREILEETDLIIKDKKIAGRLISCGLHIHFSSEVSKERRVVNVPKVKNYTPIVNLYRKKKGHSYTKDYTDVKVSVSRITNPVIKNFVTYFDEVWLDKYILDVPLKFRNPGFFETKHYGFEYRSLPFTEEVLSDIVEIAEEAWNLLEEL